MCDETLFLSFSLFLSLSFLSLSLSLSLLSLSIPLQLSHGLIILTSLSHFTLQPLSLDTLFFPSFFFLFFSPLSLVDLSVVFGCSRTNISWRRVDVAVPAALGLLSTDVAMLTNQIILYQPPCYLSHPEPRIPLLHPSNADIALTWQA